MNNRSLALGILVTMLAIFASQSNAQHSLQVDDGTGIGIITATGLPAGITSFSLPASGGMLITNASLNTTAWLLTGNSGTTAGTNFIGTTDNVALYLQVKNGVTINNSLILNTNGSIQRDPGNNARGASAVDMQIARGWVTEVAAGQFSTISGGSSNTVNGVAATVGGGFANVVYGDYSSVPGGRGLTLGGNADGTFGFLAANLGANDMSIDVANTALFGNTNLWLANNRNQASELRFYEAYNTAGAFPNTAKWVAFKSPATLTATQTYTLPLDYPTIAGQVLSSTAAGVLSWATAGGGLVNFTESLTTTAPYSATDAAARLLATNATATNITVVLQPKGNGALQAQLADNAATGGNKRGTYAVDWQMLRTLNTQVADGFGAIVGGGASNTSSGQYATVGGGNNNTASGGATTVAGGFLNNASGNRSTVGGGQQNTASGAVATVGGGQQNTAFGDFSAIPGGKGLTLGAITAGSFGFLGANSAGTNNMTINEANTAVFGNTNLWLANNTNAASELRFYEANATASGPFPPALLNYTAFKAGVQTADLTYTLPIVAPTAGQVLSSTAAGVLSWATAGGLTGSGTTNTIPKWTSSSAIGNSALTDNGTTLSYGSFFSLTSGQITTLGASFANISSNGRIVGITNNDASGGGGNSRALDINIPNAPVATGTATGIKISVASGVGISYDILGTGSNWKVTSAGALTLNPLTASSLVATDASKTLVSVANGTGVLTNNGSGTLTWAAAGGLVNFTESVNTAAPNATVPVVRLLATNAATNVDIALSPKGTGALTAQVADNTTTGGNKRGQYAVDWQMSRNNNTKVASGDYTTVGGGYSNTASGYMATVGGGELNTASGDDAMVGGGQGNTASGYGSVIAGGYGSISSGIESAVGGGLGNAANGNNTTIGGGYENITTDDFATIAGGRNNQAGDNAGTTADNQYATVGGGRLNIASIAYSTIGGGNGNTASGIQATIGGGSFNTASATLSFIPGGLNALASNYGQMAQAAGRFTTNGDAQTSVFVLRNQTTGAAATSLALDGGTAKIVIPTNGAMTFKVTIIGKETGGTLGNGNVGGWEVIGTIANNGGAALIIGANTTRVNNAPATWGAAPTVGVNGANMDIQVNGKAATNINWVARVETVEVVF